MHQRDKFRFQPGTTSHQEHFFGTYFVRVPFNYHTRELENVAPIDIRTTGRASILRDLAVLCNALLQVKIQG